MNKYLPSKKFALIFISILVALGIIYAFSFVGRTKTLTVETMSQETKNKVAEFMALDTDGDGMKDWEEALWKTDPKIADTDQDGTSDGEEVKINRNPLQANTAKAGETPSDQADMKVIAEKKKIDEEFAKLSQTDKLARTFFSQYLASKSASGNPLDDVNRQIILDTAISMTETNSQQKYTISDLKIITDSSTSTLKKYINDLGQSLNTSAGKTADLSKLKNEMAIINLAVESQDEKIIEDLTPIVKSYDVAITRILSLSIPENIVSLHLNFLNDLLFLKISIEEMGKLFSDPVSAIAGIDRYQTTVSELDKDLTAIKNYCYQKNLVFMPDESGYLFLNIIQ